MDFMTSVFIDKGRDDLPHDFENPVGIDEMTVDVCEMDRWRGGKV